MKVVLCGVGGFAGAIPQYLPRAIPLPRDGRSGRTDGAFPLPTLVVTAPG